MPGVRRHPWWAEECPVSPQVYRVHPAFPAQWFYGFLRALPGDRASIATVTPEKRWLLESLNANLGASGPHDFAVRLKRRSSARKKRATTPRRPPHPAPTFVTTADVPSFGTGRYDKGN